MRPTEYLYPQSTTFDNGSIVVTDFISNLQYADLLEKKMGEPYCIGYVEYEDFPKYIDFHKIIWDSNHIEFKTNPQNVGWGYCLQAGVSTQFPGARQMYALNDDEQVTTWFTGNDERTRFINDVKMATLNTRFGTTYGSGIFPFRLVCVYLILNNEIASDNFVEDTQFFTNQTGRFVESGNIDTTFAEFENFVKNDGALTFTASPFGTFNIKLSDFNEYNIATVQNTDQTFTLYLAIRNLYTSVMSVHGYDGTYYSRMVTPFFCYKFGELATTFLPDISTVYVPGISLNIPYISFRILQSGTNYVIDPINLTLYSEDRQGCQTGERPFTVTTQDLQNANVQYRTVGIVAGKFFIGNGGGESTNHTHYIYTQNNPTEIYKYLLFYNKAFAGNTIPSASDRWETYYTEWTTAIFDENDSPTGERITGSYTDAAFMAMLRPWQLPGASITDNEFDADDIPEYEPEPGEEGENIGDKITRPASIGVGGTNGFVTQYALNRADVAQLGTLLWTSFVDQDYWQNYLFSLALDTGTFQLSGLLNFFVSLKVYPFPLINIDSFSQWGSDMYIATGIVPLHFNNPLHVINNYCDYISGGYIDIPRYFNDYRDYINTEISLYLPFCGTVQLNPGDVIGNRIVIEYAIDFATGGCIAYVDLTTGDGAGYPVGALPGQIGADIPLTATAAGEVAARFIGDGLNVAGMIGGEVGRIGSGVAGALGGNPSGGSGGGSVFAGVAGMYGGAGAAMAADLAPGLARQGLQMLQRGAVGAPMLSGGRGFAAFGAPSKPYVQIRRGIYPTVTGLHTVDGAPAAATATISSLSGFIQGSVKADGLSCHQAEKEEIIALIASGIYV